MAGPVAAVLLPAPVSPAQRTDLEALLRSISGEFQSSDIYEWDLWVTDTRPIGGNYVGDGRPFGAHFGLGEADENDFPALEAQFGFSPQGLVQFDAHCNGDVDHRILGMLVLRTAEAFHGVIAFGGMLPARIPRELWDLDWPRIESHFRERVKEIPGKLVGIEYVTSLNKVWVSHYADAVFLRAWLAHPDFRMIK